MLLALMWHMPAAMQAPDASFKGADALIRQPEVARTLLLTLLFFTSIFTTFAYVDPVLRALGALSVPTVSFTLPAVDMWAV